MRSETAGGSSGTAYDEHPYAIVCLPHMDPGRLAAIGRLFGLDPPDPAHARVLDLGCAQGGTLIPLADKYPEASFLGVELSAEQVRQGRRLIRQAKLSNLDIQQRSILDIRPERDGMFDYVLANGVYSYVPEEVAEKILAICRDQLRPGGLVYLEHNTYPGWKFRHAARDMMLFHARHAPSAAEKLAKAKEILGLVAASSTDGKESPYGSFVAAELARLEDPPGDDSFPLHEILGAVNRACYFHEFVDRIGHFDLEYVGDTHLPSTAVESLGTEVAAKLRSLAGDWLELEQYQDFVRNKLLRRAVLCRAPAPVRREMDPGALDGLFFCSLQASGGQPAATPEPAASLPFLAHAASGKRRFQEAALATLRRRTSPRFRPFGALLTQTEALARSEDDAIDLPEGDDARAVLRGLLLRLIRRGYLEVNTVPERPPIAGERGPRLSQLARAQAAAGWPVTNSLLDGAVPPASMRGFLPLLDGTRSSADLTAEYRRLDLDGPVRPLADILRAFREHGYLAPEPDESAENGG